MKKSSSVDKLDFLYLDAENLNAKTDTNLN